MEKKDFLQQLLKKQSAEFVRKTNLFMDTRKIKYLIQRIKSQVNNHKVVQRLMQKNGWSILAVRPKKAIKIGETIFQLLTNTLNRNFFNGQTYAKVGY